MRTELGNFIEAITDVVAFLFVEQRRYCDEKKKFCIFSVNFICRCFY